MAFALIWLPGTLRAAGLSVVEESGWQDRGHADMLHVQGVICHHTAGPLTGDSPSLPVVVNGRVGLAGPLAQLFLSRSGVFHVVAAGLSYHAGIGEWHGVTAGNSHFIGIEAENTGLANDLPWPSPQMNAYARGCAAILKRIGAPVIMCAGHKEYALPHGRKSDPSFDMALFRQTVASHL